MSPEGSIYNTYNMMQLLSKYLLSQKKDNIFILSWGQFSSQVKFLIFKNIVFYFTNNKLYIFYYKSS